MFFKIHLSIQEFCIKTRKNATYHIAPVWQKFMNTLHENVERSPGGICTCVGISYSDLSGGELSGATVLLTSIRHILYIAFFSHHIHSINPYSWYSELDVHIFASIR